MHQFLKRDEQIEITLGLKAGRKRSVVNQDRTERFAPLTRETGDLRLDFFSDGNADLLHPLDFDHLIGMSGLHKKIDLQSRVFRRSDDVRGK